MLWNFSAARNFSFFFTEPYIMLYANDFRFEKVSGKCSSLHTRKELIKYSAKQGLLESSRSSAMIRVQENRKEHVHDQRIGNPTAPHQHTFGAQES